jgi:hypothetical protein
MPAYQFKEAAIRERLDGKRQWLYIKPRDNMGDRQFQLVPFMSEDSELVPFPVVNGRQFLFQLPTY